MQTRKRLPTIKTSLLKGLNRDQIGEKCGVTEKTIDRDVKAWVESGDFETWIKEEFLRLHAQIIHNDPVEAYRQITKLLGRTLTQRVEAIQEIRHIELSWKIDESKTRNKVQSS